MVRSGWAWAMPRFSKDLYPPAQEEAERQNRGVWAGHANCEAPGEAPATEKLRDRIGGEAAETPTTEKR